MKKVCTRQLFFFCEVSELSIPFPGGAELMQHATLVLGRYCSGIRSSLHCILFFPVVYLVYLSIRDICACLMLYPRRNDTLPTLIWRWWRSCYVPQNVAANDIPAWEAAHREFLALEVKIFFIANFGGYVLC